MSSLFSNVMEINGNVCFLSDAHFGTPNQQDSQKREDVLVSLLNQIGDDIQHLFLLGDIFDFWFEYRDVVPKGYFRLFNTLYNLSKKGVKIYYFTGNHDMWVQDYFEQQFDCQVFIKEHAFLLNGKRCVIAHGDGLGGKQRKYLLIKGIFGFKPNRVLYSMLHPRQAFSIARYCSKISRESHPDDAQEFKGEQEHQVQYARQVLENEPVDFFIFGHRHIPKQYVLTDDSMLFNCGDWLSNFSYLIFNQEAAKPQLMFFKSPESREGDINA